MARKISVEIVGDASSLQRAFNQAGGAGSTFGSKMKTVGKLAGVTLAAGVGLAAVALKKSYDAAIDAEKAQTRLDAAFRAVNATTKERTAALLAVNKVSQQSGLDDEDLSDSLSRLSRVTGDVTKAQQEMAIAANIARGRGIELGAATQIVSKAALGQLGALKRIGIEIPKVTAAQDALKESHGKVSEAQKAAAKAADDAATRAAAIAALQKQYAGDAEAYGKTAAGAQERFRVALENLEEELGAKLLPVVTRVMTWLADNMPAIERVVSQAMDGIGAAITFVQPALEKLAQGFAALAAAAQRYWPAIQKAAEQVVAWYQTNLAPAIDAVVQTVTALWRQFGDDILKIAQATLGQVWTIVKTVLGNIKSTFEIFFALLRGDWGQAWDSLTDIVSRTLNAVVSLLKGAVTIWSTIAKSLGSAIIDGVMAGLSALVSKVKEKLGDIGGAISGAAETAHDAAVRIGQALIGGVLDGLAGLWNAVKSKVEGILRGVLGALNPFSPVEHGGELYIAQPIIAGAVAGLEKNAPKLFDSLNKILKTLDKMLPSFYDRGYTAGMNIATGLLDSRGAVLDAANALARAIANSLGVAAQTAKLETDTTVNLLAGKAGGYSHFPGKQAGGPVSAGRAYIVGEQGSELFVPSMSGNIIPHGSAAAGGNTYVFQFPNYVGDRDELVAEVRRGLIEMGRRTGGNLLGGLA